MKMLKENGVFMILEDDARCCVENPLDILKQAFSELPADWDALLKAIDNDILNVSDPAAWAAQVQIARKPKQ